MDSFTVSANEDKEEAYPFYHFEKNEILCLLAVFFISLSFANFSPYAPVYLKALFNVESYLSLGAISIITNAMIALGTPIWGRLADIYHPKNFVILGASALSLMYFTLVFSNSSTFFLVSIFIGYLFGSAQTGNIFALATISTKKSKEVVLSKISIVMSLSWLVMSPIAGKIYDTMENSYEIQMIIASVSCLIAVIVIFFSSEIKVEDKQNNQAKLKPKKENLTDFILAFIVVILLSFLFQLVSGGFWSFNTLYFIDYLQINGSVYSNFLVAVTILGICTSYLLGRVKSDLKNTFVLIFFSFLQTLIFFIMMLFPYNGILNLILYSFPMYPIYNVTFYSLVTSLTKLERRATAYGLLNSIGIFGTIVGVILFGLIADSNPLGIVSMLSASFYASLSVLICAILFFLIIRKKESREN